MEFKYLTDFSKEELDSNVVIPCIYEDYYCILIKNKYQKDFVSIRKTDNLEIRLNTVVSREKDDYYVHIIKSVKNDKLYNQQFSIVYSYVFQKMKTAVSDDELNDLINSLEEYFRITPEEEREKFQIGVFGELLTIKNFYNQGYEQITNKYHRNFYSKHDIEISKNIRIEIKTTGKHNRIHHFSHDQLVREDIQVYIVSIKLEPSEQGTSLYEMFEFVLSLYKDPDSLFELHKLMKKCNVNLENQGLRFSEQLAILETKVFLSSDLPHVENNFIPNGITKVSYDVNCDLAKEMTFSDLIKIIKNKIITSFLNKCLIK